MYLKRVVIDNLGAIKKINIDLPFNSDGSPQPLVLVGKNGSGKTLLTASIVDAFIELKRKNYNQPAEVRENNYYKAGKKDYISAGENYSFVCLNFETKSNETVSYFDITTLEPESTRQLLSHYPISFDATYNESGHHKSLQGDNKKFFEENIIAYYPVNRYYNPAWLVEKQTPTFSIKERIFGADSNNIIKVDVISEIEAWILEVILDYYLYELKTTTMVAYIMDASRQFIPMNIPMSQELNGKNTKIRIMINLVLLTMFKARDETIVSARFGINKKEHGRKISIYIKRNGEEEIIAAPTFSHLSSGEAMIVSLFCSLIKNFDNISSVESIDLGAITGTVIIDEIDLTLHIEFTKKVLPELLSLFPNVQFIITSHSPFFLLGMKEKFGENYQIINMPDGQIIIEDNFSEIESAYNIFIENFENLKNNIDQMKNELSQSTKPLIITEGKTDWKHIKNALRIKKERGEFRDLDVEFHEYEDASFSDSHLQAFLNNNSKVKNNRVVIGIFDRDEANGKKHSMQEFVNLGNNTFAISIPQPEHRSYHEGICIELMYKDDDLFKCDNEGRRLYVSSEFNEDGRLIGNVEIGLKNSNKIKGKQDRSKDDIIDSEVISIRGESLALSKNNFSTLILNQEPPFDTMDISSFDTLFESLRRMLN